MRCKNDIMEEDGDEGRIIRGCTFRIVDEEDLKDVEG